MARGDGTIRRRGDAWEVDIRVLGRRVRRLCATQDEARRVRAALRAEKALRDDGRPVGVRPECTYREVGERLLDYLGADVDRERTERTKQGARYEIRQMLAWWGERRLAHYTDGEAQDFVAALRRAKASTSVIRHLLDRVSQCHAQARRDGWLAGPPPRVPRPAYRARKERDATTEAEVAALLAAAVDTREELLVLLGRDAGLRRIEIGRLRGADVELADWDGRCHGWIQVHGKGDRRRAVPILTDRLRDALVARGPRDDEPVLEGIRTAGGARYLYDGLRARAGVAATLHQLRHACSTWLRDCGHSSAHRRAWLGHLDERTGDLYLHGAPPPDPEVADRARRSQDGRKEGGTVLRLVPRTPARSDS